MNTSDKEIFDLLNSYQTTPNKLKFIYPLARFSESALLNSADKIFASVPDEDLDWLILNFETIMPSKFVFDYLLRRLGRFEKHGMKDTSHDDLSWGAGPSGLDALIEKFSSLIARFAKRDELQDLLFRIVLHVAKAKLLSDNPHLLKIANSHLNRYSNKRLLHFFFEQSEAKNTFFFSGLRNLYGAFSDSLDEEFFALWNEALFSKESLLPSDYLLFELFCEKWAKTRFRDINLEKLAALFSKQELSDEQLHCWSLAVSSIPNYAIGFAAFAASFCEFFFSRMKEGFDIRGTEQKHIALRVFHEYLRKIPHSAIHEEIRALIFSSEPLAMEAIDHAKGYRRRSNEEAIIERNRLWQAFPCVAREEEVSDWFIDSGNPEFFKCIFAFERVSASLIREKLLSLPESFSYAESSIALLLLKNASADDAIEFGVEFYSDRYNDRLFRGQIDSIVTAAIKSKTAI